MSLTECVCLSLSVYVSHRVCMSLTECICVVVLQVVFEFVSSSMELVESFWRFVIPEQNISIPFLVVGNTHDPAVSLDRSHLNFKSLLIGQCLSSLP